MLQRRTPSNPSWMSTVLWAAAVYNLLWGAAVIVWPGWLFALFSMEPPRYPEIWQCVGMIVGVYGIGYAIAATNPFRHWPIVLVGFLGKTFGPLGFLKAASSGALPWAWGWIIVFNDLVWWVPFAVTLYLTFRHLTDTSIGQPDVSLVEATTLRRSHRGATLKELSQGRPTLVLFLRHTGCTFCREALAMVGARRAEIERAGGEIALVHMGTPMDATIKFAEFGLEGVHRFSDPHCELYRAFGLNRGSLTQLFGWHVFLKAIVALGKGHGFGGLQGDGFRMPGVFRLRDGRIEEAFRAPTAADHPDYFAMATGIYQVTSTNEESGTELVAG